jgi:hypothetical protein
MIVAGSASPLLLSSAGGYNLTNSLRFRSSASAYLNRTPASAGNRTTWTWSSWLKIGSPNGSDRYIFAAGASAGGGLLTGLVLTAADKFELYWNSSGSSTLTTAVYRDYAAWYHVCLVANTTTLTLFVNNVQVAQRSISGSAEINNTVVHRIGSRADSGITGVHFDGYLAETNFIDGQALSPSSFGAFSATTGVWQPIEYTGTYGTNGFYLPFLTSPASFAGSFNGTNQLISVAANAAFNFTGDFTAECWYNTSTVTNASQPTLFTIGSDATGLIVAFFSGTFYCYMLGSGALMTAATPPLNQWVHVAWVRVGSTNTLYLNGVATATATISGTLSSTGGVTVGRTGSSGTAFQHFQGLVSNFRLNNTALYTSNFTPPTSALTAVSGTQLLTLQNATIIDNSTNAFTITNTNSVTTSSDNPFTYSISQDRSGNGNNWTPNNISLTAGVTYDSMTDVPTLTSATAANYCVINPLVYRNSVGQNGYSNGNLTLSGLGAAVTYFNMATIGVNASSGKFYWECQIGAASSGIFIGVTQDSNFQSGDWDAWYDSSGGALYKVATNVASVASATTNDVIGIAYDSTANTCAFYKNNTLLGTVTGLTSATMFPLQCSRASAVLNLNFGQRPFAYTPPTGFVALNTFNLPTPTIGASASTLANKNMDVTLYTGAGNTSTSITNAAGFQPDFVWTKARSIGYSNYLYDSVRGTGTGASLVSNGTGAEGADASNANLSSFNSNGWTIGTTAGTNALNASGQTFVAWQWRANGAAVTNTAGSISSQVSANTSAGFSVVTYTGTGANATVGHGLGVAPSFIISKNRSSGSTDWPTYHISTGNNGGCTLNETAAKATTAIWWNNTTPSSSVVTLGNGSQTNGSTSLQVLYCFAQIAGYSAFGSYTGNGSADGPFVFTGFRPRYIMWKRSDSTGDWIIFDTARDTFNYADKQLLANTSGAEAVTGGGFVREDFLSNGFKIRSTDSYINANGGTYIYAAFAESPFKYANAR